MNRDEVLNVLRAHKATLVQRFGVVDLALFGSIVRDQATDDSDVESWCGSTRRRRQSGILVFNSTLKTCWGVRLIW